MELSKAKIILQEAIDGYNSKIAEFGIKTKADVYFVDSKAFLECDENDKYLGSLCGSITLVASDATDEEDMCGFDIVVDIKNRKSVIDAEFEKAFSEFSEYADDFIKRCGEAEDKDAFIKEESKREKNESAEKMKKFEEDMQKLQTTIVAGVCAVVVLFLICFFASLFLG